MEESFGEVWRLGLDWKDLVVSIGRQYGVGFEGHQSQTDQSIPCDLELPEVQADRIADLLFAIEANAVAICRQNQEQIQGQIFMGHLLEVAIA